jgi:hypothetical protein
MTKSLQTMKLSRTGPGGGGQGRPPVLKFVLKISIYKGLTPNKIMLGPSFVLWSSDEKSWFCPYKLWLAKLKLKKKQKKKKEKRNKTS